LDELAFVLVLLKFTKGELLLSNFFVKYLLDLCETKNCLDQLQLSLSTKNFEPKFLFIFHQWTYAK